VQRASARPSRTHKTEGGNIGGEEAKDRRAGADGGEQQCGGDIDVFVVRACVLYLTMAVKQ
jgi:hypothetical protein